MAPGGTTARQPTVGRARPPAAMARVRFILAATALSAVSCGGDDGVGAVGADVVRDPVVDAAAGFRLRWPGPGWSLLDGNAATSFYSGALAGALGPDGAAFVWRETNDRPAHIVVSELATRLTSPGDVRDNTGTSLNDTPAQQFTIEVPLASAPLFVQGVVVSRRGEALILAHTSHRDADASVAEIRDAIELTEPESPAFALAAEPPPETLVEGATVLRDGVYRDFARGLSWTRPDPSWRLVAGHDARRIDPQAAAVLDREGITAMLIVEGGNAERRRPTPPSFAEVRWRDDVRTIDLGDEDGRLWSGRIRGSGRPVSAITAIRDTVSVTVVAWSLVGEIPRGALDAIAGGLDLGARSEATTMSIEGFVDHRMGFALDLPSGWRRDTLSLGPGADLSQMVRFRQDDRWIGIFSVQTTPDQVSSWAGHLRRQVADRFARAARGSATRRPGTLAGRPADHVQWASVFQRVDLWLVDDGTGRLHAVVAADQDDTAATLVAGGFRFTK
ncbi:MAG: hypothetical protein AAGN82_03870 [Myxococcota bacterium]